MPEVLTVKDSLPEYRLTQRLVSPDGKEVVGTLNVEALKGDSWEYIGYIYKFGSGWRWGMGAGEVCNTKEMAAIKLISTHFDFEGEDPKKSNRFDEPAYLRMTFASTTWKSIWISLLETNRGELAEYLQRRLDEVRKANNGRRFKPTEPVTIAVSELAHTALFGAAVRLKFDLEINLKTQVKEL